LYTRAIVRPPAENCGRGLTTAGLGPPDPAVFLAQHRAYVDTLRSLGLQIIELAPESAFPDAHFVEDTAVIVPELAVIARPGAAARRGEERGSEAVLAWYRPVARIVEPGTLEGGDVLVAGRQVFVGRSARTNAAGVSQLAQLLSPHGYDVTAIPVVAGLHLKSCVNGLGDDALLLTEDFARREEFRPFAQIVVAPGEEYAANVLWIDGHLLVPAGFPRTHQRLQTLGWPLHELAMSEARKMDGGLTCLSLRF
jgi:dimethylargininase